MTLTPILGLEGQTPDIDILVEKVGLKADLYREITNFKANVIATLYNMDKNWKPKKIEVVEKIVTIKGNRRTEEILSAIEKKKGKVKNLTVKYQNDARKAAEKARRQPEKSQKRGRRDLDLTLREYTPFTKDKRENYTYRLVKESQWGGQPVYLIAVTSRTKSDREWSGTYFIHQESFDIIRAEISPSKKPGVLKQFNLELDFQVLPGNHLALLRSKIKIHVGLVIKNIRVVAEEVYLDYNFQQPD